MQIEISLLIIIFAAFFLLELEAMMNCFNPFAASASINKFKSYSSGVKFDEDDPLSAKIKDVEGCMIYAEHPFALSSSCRGIQYFEVELGNADNKGIFKIGFYDSAEYGRDSLVIDSDGTLHIRAEQKIANFGEQFGDKVRAFVGCGIFSASDGKFYAFFTRGGKIIEKLIVLEGDKNKKLRPKITMQENVDEEEVELKANFNVDTTEFKMKLKNLAKGGKANIVGTF